MGTEFLAALRWLLGIGIEELNLLQMALRAVFIFIAAIVMVRVGDKRFLGKNTAFDVILGVILGSVLSRAINGSASLLPTLGASFALVGLHWLFAALAFRSDRFATFIKGSSRKLVEKGEIQWEGMRKSHISEKDLLDAVRSEGKAAGLAAVEEAYLDRSGNIRVIQKEAKAAVLEVSVAAGVQTVRIQIER